MSKRGKTLARRSAKRTAVAAPTPRKTKKRGRSGKKRRFTQKARAAAIAQPRQGSVCTSPREGGRPQARGAGVLVPLEAEAGEGPRAPLLREEEAPEQEGARGFSPEPPEGARRAKARRPSALGHAQPPCLCAARAFRRFRREAARAFLLWRFFLSYGAAPGTFTRFGSEWYEYARTAWGGPGGLRAATCRPSLAEVAASAAARASVKRRFLPLRPGASWSCAGVGAATAVGFAERRARVLPRLSHGLAPAVLLPRDRLAFRSATSAAPS